MIRRTSPLRHRINPLLVPEPSNFKAHNYNTQAVEGTRQPSHRKTEKQEQLLTQDYTSKFSQTVKFDRGQLFSKETKTINEEEVHSKDAPESNPQLNESKTSQQQK